MKNKTSTRIINDINSRNVLSSNFPDTKSITSKFSQHNVPDAYNILFEKNAIGIKNDRNNYSPPKFEAQDSRRNHIIKTIKKIKNIKNNDFTNFLTENSTSSIQSADRSLSPQSFCSSKERINYFINDKLKLQNNGSSIDFNSNINTNDIKNIKSSRSKILGRNSVLMVTPSTTKSSKFQTNQTNTENSKNRMLRPNSTIFDSYLSKQQMHNRPPSLNKKILTNTTEIKKNKFKKVYNIVFTGKEYLLVFIP